MSHLKYYTYPGFGENAREKLWYSQAVRVGDRIEISGQGGWDPATSEVKGDVYEQVEQAFATIDTCLKAAGGKGWSQVYRINSYHTKFGRDSLEATAKSMRKWTPDHHPIWTAVGVERLGRPEMLVEIEVVALDEEGAKAARGA